MKRVYEVYCRAEEVICGIFFFAIVVLVFSSAFLRLFKMPLIWADDIAKLLFAWTAFLGADVAMRRCRLVGVDFVMVRLPPKVQKAIQLAGNLIIAIILVAFVYFGFKLTVASWDRYFQTITASYSFVTMCLPVGSLCMLLTAGIKIGKLLAHFGDDDYTLAKDAQREEPDDVERQVV